MSIELQFGTVRGRMAAAGCLVGIGVVLLFPTISGELRLVGIAGYLTVGAAYLGRRSSSARLAIWLVSLAGLAAFQRASVGEVEFGDDGFFPAVYLTALSVWIGGVGAGSRDRSPSATSAASLVALLIGTWQIDGLANFSLAAWFVLLSAVWISFSVNAYLRRAEEEVQDAMSSVPLRRSAHAWSAHLSRQGHCSSPCGCDWLSAAENFTVSNELRFLVRQRALGHQFSEWRTRSREVEGAYLEPSTAVSLGTWLSRQVGVEASPLSVRATEQDDMVEIALKAEFPSLSDRDLAALDGRSGLLGGIKHLPFGRVVHLQIPLATGNPRELEYEAESIGQSPRRFDEAFLNDVVGGGVAGDNHRFGRLLLWLFALHPLSVGVQRYLLDVAPGPRAPIDVPSFLLLLAMLGTIGLAAVVAVRRKEAVTTRASWLISLLLGFAASVLLYAVVDRENSLWNTGEDFRYLHPILGCSLALSLLIVVWGPHVPPRRLGTAVRHSSHLADGELRSAALSLAPGLAVGVGVMIAGLRSGEWALDDWLSQASLWLAASAAVSLLGVVVARCFFLGVEELVYHAVCEYPVAPGADPDDVHDDSCQLRSDAVKLMNEWPTMAFPVATAIAAGGGTVRHATDERSMVVDLPVERRSFESHAASIDRAMLVSGMRATSSVADSRSALALALESAMPEGSWRSWMLSRSPSS